MAQAHYPNELIMLLLVENHFPNHKIHLWQQQEQDRERRAEAKKVKAEAADAVAGQ